MNKVKFLTIATIVLLISNLLLVIFINFRKHGPPPHHGPHKEGPRNEMIEILKFDEKQVVQFDSLIQKHREALDAKMESITQAKQKLYNTLNSVSNDSLENAYINDICNEHREVEKLHLAHFKEIKSICRPEQMNNYAELTRNLAKMFSRKPPRKR